MIHRGTEENGGFGSDVDFLASSGDFFRFILPSVNRKIGVQNYWNNNWKKR